MRRKIKPVEPIRRLICVFWIVRRAYDGDITAFKALTYSGTTATPTGHAWTNDGRIIDPSGYSDYESQSLLMFMFEVEIAEKIVYREDYKMSVVKEDAVT